MKVYQCDRCKAIYEPRKLDKGEPYVTRKNMERTKASNGDVDLCPECYMQLMMWLDAYKGVKQ